MAMTGAEVEVKIRAEGAEQVARELGQADTATQNFANQTNKLSGTMATVGKVGRASFVGLTLPILGATGVMVNAASDQAEAFSKTNVVFGDSAQQVQGWANTSVTSMGLSKTAYLDAAGSLGNLYTGMGMSQDAAAGMSNDTLQLAADLSSFNNVPFPEALAAIQSGLVGEAEPMRRFGVLLNEANVNAKAMEMGLADANGEISEQAKVLARQQLIMEQTQNAQGDFSRTSEGLANQQRILRAQLANLSAEMGAVLLPIVTKVVGGITGFIGKLSGMSSGLKTAIVVFGLVAAAIGPILIAVSMMMPALSMVGAAFAAISSPVWIVIAALVALGVAYKTNFLGFGDAVRKVASLVATGFGKITDFVKRAANIFGQFNSKTNPVRAALMTLIALFPRLAGVIQPIIFAVERFTSVFTGLRDAGVNPVTAAFRALGAALPGLSGTFSHLAEAASAVLDAFRSLMNGDIRGFFSNIAEAALESAKALLTSYKEVGTLILNGFKAIPWAEAWKGIQDAWDAIPWTQLAVRGVQLLVNGLRAGAGAAGNIFQWISDALQNALQSMSNTFMSGLQMAWDMISDISWRDFIPDLDWGAIVGKAIDIGSSILSWAKETLGSINWGGIVGKVTSVGAGVLNWLKGLLPDISWSSMVGTLTSVGAGILTVGKDLLGAISWTSIVGSVTSVGAGVLNWVKGLLPDISWEDMVGAAIDLGNKLLEWIKSKINIPPFPGWPSAGDIAGWVKDKIFGEDDPTAGNGSVTAPNMSDPMKSPRQYQLWDKNWIPGTPNTTPYENEVPLGGFRGNTSETGRNPAGNAKSELAGLPTSIPAPDISAFIGAITAAQTAVTTFVAASISVLGGLSVGVPAIMTTVGTALTGISTSATTAQTSFITFVTAVMSVMGGLAAGVPAILSTVASSLTSTTSSSTSAAKQSYIALVTAVMSVMGGYAAGVPAIVNSVASSLQSRISSSTAAGKSSYIALVTAVMSVMGGYSSGVTAIVNAVASNLQSRTQQSTSAARSAFSSMTSSVSGYMSSMRGSVQSAMGGIQSSISSGMSSATGAIRNNASQWAGILSSQAGAMRGAGVSVGLAAGEGVAAGMRSAAGSVRAAANEIISEVDRAMRAKAQIKSPSRLLAIVGSFLTWGVAKGLVAADRLRDLRRQVGVVTDTVRDSAQRDLSRKLSGTFSAALNGEIGDSLVPIMQSASTTRSRAYTASQGYVPVPVPPNRGGMSQNSGNVYVVMTREELLDLFDTVDAVKVMTDPVEQRAIFGGQ